MEPAGNRKKSKTEYYVCIQTSFRDVSTNNASSGLKKGW